MPATIDKTVEKRAHSLRTEPDQDLTMMSPGNQEPMSGKINFAAVIVLLLAGVVFSVMNGNLFLKELLVSGFIILMVFVLHLFDSGDNRVSASGK